MKEYEKLIGFIILLAAICWLAWMTSGEQTFVMVDGKPVSVSSGSGMRDVLVGMIGVLGMAGQALFRTNEMAAAMNELLARTVEKLGNSSPTVPPDPGTTTTTTVTTGGEGGKGGGGGSTGGAGGDGGEGGDTGGKGGEGGAGGPPTGEASDADAAADSVVEAASARRDEIKDGAA